MRTVERNEACPCGSGVKYKKCCLPVISGDVRPESAEQLMRSRYTAYVLGNASYLWQTTHPENEERVGISEEKFKSDTLSYCRQVDFTGLQVKQTWPEDENGIAKVQFTCTYKTKAGESGDFTELSDFVRLDENWVYLRGEQD